MKEGDIARYYDESFQFLDRRKTRQAAQLVLMNNLQRGDQNIASTLLLTLFNRIMSNMWDDKMQVKFIPGEEIDQRQINSLNILAQNDYREMDMELIDYDWTWDTLFFGRGYLETKNFDKKRKLLKPTAINPLAFGYDPFFTNKDDWRYYWKWIIRNKQQIWSLIKAGKLFILDPNEIPSGVDPYLWQYKIQREQAKLASPQANDSYQGDVYQILEFYGYDDEGNKCVYWTDRDVKKIIYTEKLDLRDDEDGKSSKWPLIIKEAFREPHATVSFSVADLLEDKHRARSVLLNLAFIASKDKANPLYQYNPDNVIDQTQLLSRQISQHIPVKDINASIAPVNTQSPMDPGLMAFMQILNQEANDPMGTGMTLQPAKKGKQSATETSIQQQLNDLAQSLQSKVMQFGVRDFWSDWYQRYKRYTKAGDTKIATIVGVKGMTFESIDLKDIHTKYPPGVLIFSAKEAEYKELVVRRDLMQMYPQFQESFGQEGMKLFNKYVFLPKFLQDPSLIDVLIPKSLDELKSEDENEQLSKDIWVDVAQTDDHQTHLMVHKMIHQSTWAKWYHMWLHEQFLAAQKKQEMQQQNQPPQGQQGQQPGQPQQQGQAQKPMVGQAKQNPQEAAAPLKQELVPQGNNKQ